MLENKTINNKAWILKSILSAWLILAAGVMLYVMIEHQILLSTFRMGMIMVTAVILVLLIFGLARAQKRWTFATMAVIISIVAAFYTLGAYTVLTTAGGLNKMTTTEPETVSMALVARNDYPDDFADRINTSKIGLALAQDEENIRNFLRELQENNIAPQPVERSSYSEAAQALLSADTDLMVLNEAYRPLIEEVLPQFSTDTKVLEVYHIEAVTEAPPVTEVPSETAANAVNIYLSGIDTRGPMTSSSRSDVNILVTMNFDQKRAQILSVPRDSYVQIPGYGMNEYDKLTHAGVYGVNTSRQTMENLLLTQIPYYARVNFTSFRELIDAVGGITIDNPAAFSHGEHYFPQGEVELNGEQALAFVRERYSLAEGDIGRSNNQVILIEALMKKMLQPAMLPQIPSLINMLGDSVDTNMRTNEMMNVANQFMTQTGDWEFEQVVLEGTGASGLPSYAMPGSDLYMYVLDEESLKEAQTKIHELMIKE